MRTYLEVLHGEGHVSLPMVAVKFPIICRKELSADSAETLSRHSKIPSGYLLEMKKTEPYGVVLIMLCPLLVDFYALKIKFVG